MSASNLHLSFAFRTPTEDEKWFLSNINLLVQAANELGILLFGGAVRDLEIGILPTDLDFITPKKYPDEIAKQVLEDRQKNVQYLSYRQIKNEGKDFESNDAMRRWQKLIEANFNTECIIGDFSDYPLDELDLIRYRITRKIFSNEKPFTITVDFASHRLFKKFLDVNVNGLYYDCNGNLCGHRKIDLKQTLADCKLRQFRIIQKGTTYNAEKIDGLIPDRRYIYELFKTDSRLEKMISKGWNLVLKENDREVIYNKSQASKILSWLSLNNHLPMVGTKNTPDQRSILQIPRKKSCAICAEIFENEVFIHKLACCKKELHVKCHLDRIYSPFKKHGKYFFRKRLNCPIDCEGDPYDWKTGGKCFSGQISAYVYPEGYVSLHNIENKNPIPISWSLLNKDNCKRLFIVSVDGEIVVQEFIVTNMSVWELIIILQLHRAFQNIWKSKKSKNSRVFFLLINCDRSFYTLFDRFESYKNLAYWEDICIGPKSRRALFKNYPIKRYSNDKLTNLIEEFSY